MLFFTSFINAYVKADNLWFTIKYIVVATLFLSALWFFSRYLTKKYGGISFSNHIKIIEKKMIFQGKALVWVEFEKTHYLLAVDKTNIVLIDKRTDLETTQTVQENEAPQSPEFLDFLKNSILKQGKKTKE